MKSNRYFIGVLAALLFSVGLSVAACAQEVIPEQPMLPEEAPAVEQPIAPEGQPMLPEEAPAPERFPMDEAIKAALTTFPEAQAVSAKFNDPLLGGPVYLIELSNGMEVKVDAQTGEVLGSEQISEPSSSVALLSQTTVPLEQAVTTVLDANPDRAAVEAKLVEEEGNLVYVIKLDNGEEIREPAIGAEEQPATEAPVEEPTVEEPTTPAEEVPETPAAETPAEEQPATEAPATEAPVEEPVS